MDSATTGRLALAVAGAAGVAWAVGLGAPGSRPWLDLLLPLRSRRPIPVTVLAGFLGAGKTTVLSHLLMREKGRRRVGAVVNDFAEVNVDAGLIRSLEGKGALAGVVEVQDGCICCSALGGLVEAAGELVGRHRGLDAVVVECSGLSLPSGVIEGLAQAGAQGVPLVIDTVVGVIDANTLVTWLEGAGGGEEGAGGGGEGAGGGEEGDELRALLAEQIESADVIVLNKADLLSPGRLAEAHGALRALNPRARVEAARFGAVDPSLLLATGRRVHPSPLPSRSPSHSRQHSHSHDAHGHSHGEGEHHGHGVEGGGGGHKRWDTWVWRSGRPMHPGRLGELLQGARGGGALLMRGVLRSKGTLWLATSPEESRIWAHAGGRLEVTRGGPWRAAGGGRGQEVVFIGRASMDRPGIVGALEACLLTEAEFGAGEAEWARTLRDTLPVAPGLAERAAQRAKKSHPKMCPCCDPELKNLDRLAI